jgi:hypothetical protein
MRPEFRQLPGDDLFVPGFSSVGFGTPSWWFLPGHLP